MSASVRNRIRCPKCNEKLSYSAFMRHKNPLICPYPLRAGADPLSVGSVDGLQAFESNEESVVWWPGVKGGGGGGSNCPPCGA